MSTDGEPIPASVSETELNTFYTLKDQLNEALKKYGSSLFEEKTTPPYAGLVNQGATCYLNSLIQSLYCLDPFRKAVFAWRYDPQIHGEAKDCIPLQLQKLFGTLCLSTRSAVTTSNLTTSFGWDNDEAFYQHDVQELARVLFEALQLSDVSSTPTSSTDNTTSSLSFMSFLPQLFSGTCADVLTCLSCGNTAKRNDAFMDLTLPIMILPQRIQLPMHHRP